MQSTKNIDIIYVSSLINSRLNDCMVIIVQTEEPRKHYF